MVCLINGALPGMSVLNPETGRNTTAWTPTTVAPSPPPCWATRAPSTWSTLTADQRATAIQTGEVDVIFRNTTNTLTRDADGATSVPPSSTTARA